MQNILNRRSTRTYIDKPISDQVLKQLLQAAMQAPSAMNKQLWEFILIKDKEVLEEITKVHPYSKMLLKAGAAILVCGDTSKEHFPGFFVEDCSAASENILIAAESLGLGACWIGIYPVPEFVLGMKKLFDLPENIVPVSLISLGYKKEEKPREDRFDLAKIHLDNYYKLWEPNHSNEYLKVRIELKDYPTKLYREMYIKPDINLLDLAIIFLDSVGAWFGHYFLYQGDNQEFMASEWIEHSRHEFELKNHVFKDINLDSKGRCTLTYDTGEDYCFTIQVLESCFVESNQEAIFIKGKGGNIVEDGHAKLCRIIEKDTSPCEWDEFSTVTELEIEEFYEEFDSEMYNQDIEDTVNIYKPQLLERY